MASILGYEVSQIIQSRDGRSVSCTILKDGKIIGNFIDYISDNATINIHSVQYLERFQADIQRYYTAFPAIFTDQEAFIRELIELKETETAFLENNQKGYPLTVKLCFQYRSEDKKTWLKRVGDTQYIQPYKLQAAVSERQLQRILDRENPLFYCVYRSLSDFIIE